MQTVARRGAMKQTFIIREACDADSLGIATVHVNAWQSAYQGIVPESYLAALDIETKQEQWERILKNLQDSVIFVAEKEGKIIGFVNGGKNQSSTPPYEAEIYAIYVEDSFQGQGVGKQLTHNLVKWLKEYHYTSLIVWVFEDNPHSNFYRKLGGVLTPFVETRNYGDKQLKEISYGWKDLRGWDFK